MRILTVVGELHSLTDWHVSEASDDAELDDFYSSKTDKNGLCFISTILVRNSYVHTVDVSHT